MYVEYHQEHTYEQTTKYLITHRARNLTKLKIRERITSHRSIIGGWLMQNFLCDIDLSCGSMTLLRRLQYMPVQGPPER